MKKETQESVINMIIAAVISVAVYYSLNAINEPVPLIDLLVFYSVWYFGICIYNKL